MTKPPSTTPSTPRSTPRDRSRTGPQAPSRARSWNWPLRLAAFAVWFAREVVTSNITVVRDNLTRGQDSNPQVVAFTTRCDTDAEFTLLAALITLTPGTLTLGTRTQPNTRPDTHFDGAPDIRSDAGAVAGSDAGSDAGPDVVRDRRSGTEVSDSRGRVLYVHGLYAADPDALRDELRDMETRMLHALRRRGAVR